MSATLFLHPAMSAAQVTQLCSENNLSLCQDGRGHLSLEQRQASAVNDFLAHSRLASVVSLAPPTGFDFPPRQQ